MKFKLFVLIILITKICFSQKETAWWPFGSHAFLNFNTNPPSVSFNSNTLIFESNASISDNVGNLLFYTNGDTIFGSNHQPLPNGTNLYPQNFYGYSITQGSLFIKKPNSLNEYLLFMIASDSHRSFIKCYQINTTLNSGIGDVENSFFLKDEDYGLTEKMTATKNCNNKDIWLLTAELTDPISQDGSLPIFDGYHVTFMSYLITQSGISNYPIKSKINLPNVFQRIGQLKFNSKGDKLAYAGPFGIMLFNFDKFSGEVTLNNFINLQLDNGYGVEFSPDDSKIYINEKQYDLTTGNLTSLIDFVCPSQIQRGLNDRLYKMISPKNEFNYFQPINNDNGFVCFGNSNSILELTEIQSPNIQGVACNFDTNFVHQYQNGAANFRIGLPNFPSYYFYHPRSEFAYDFSCEKDSTEFYLINTSNQFFDSTKWLFPDDVIVSYIDTVNYLFQTSGNYQVGCITFLNGNSDTTFQCVDVCGKGVVNFPDLIDLCNVDTIELKGFNTCGIDYKWNTGDTTSWLIVSSPGVYILQTSNICGYDFDTVTVISSDCTPYLFVPNVFSPNSDNVNEKYSIDIKNIQSLNYILLNRWGNVVNKSNIEIPNNLTIQTTTIELWDGRDKFQNLYPEGVYFYRIELTDINNKEILKTGFFHLIHN